MRINPAELGDDIPYHNNLVRATYNNPDMYRGFASLSGRVHSASNLDDRTRELIVLTIAGHLKATFEWASHEVVARRIGVTDAEIAALKSTDPSAFSGADRAIIEFALSVEQCRIDDAQWKAARQHFSDLQLLDAAQLAGFYGLASRIVLALDVQP